MGAHQAHIRSVAPSKKTNKSITDGFTGIEPVPRGEVVLWGEIKYSTPLLHNTNCLYV